jgi:poly-gamma-glutamate synthesis protein (capsule biosynthesis protein)
MTHALGRVLGRRAALAGAAALLLEPAHGPSERSPIELWLGGDVQLGDRREPSLVGLSAALAGAAGIVNLEGPVGPAIARPIDGDRVVLWNAPGALAGLRAAGVRVVGIANNHAGDHGPDGPRATQAALEAAALSPAGGPAGAARLDGVRVTAHDLTQGVPAHLAAELAHAARDAAALVSTFHVTGPPSYLPRPELRAAVELALAAGARVVAAHGTHALGPVERRGRAVIAWGLGNLLFDCACTDELDGALLRVSIDGEALRARIIPIDAGLRGAPARPAHDLPLILELLAALGSSPLEPTLDGALF